MKNTKKSVFTGMNINLALNEAPAYRQGGDELDRALLVELSPYMPEMRQAFDGFSTARECRHAGRRLRYDARSEPCADRQHTLDPFQYEPFDLDEGTWDARKDDVADRSWRTSEASRATWVRRTSSAAP